tara:strand:- start:260 stop:829 length:570 start_codon:yes stop_codon:yes gene_type:complete
MFTSFERDIDPKNLYFKLNNSFQIISIEHQSPAVKFAGLYAIYKNDVCYYVGQSQNLASRVCQHINGKYSSVDRVEIFLARASGFNDFHSRSKESRKSILESNESNLIKILNPIENLMLPNEDFAIGDDAVFTDLEEPDISLVLDEQHVTVHQGRHWHFYECKGLENHNSYVIDTVKMDGLESAEKELC